MTRKATQATDVQSLDSAEGARNRPRFTETFIKTAPAPEKSNRIWFDSHPDSPKGFGLRVTAAGSRAFILRYLLPGGANRIMTIGTWPTWSLAAARLQAQEERRKVEQGIDPMEAEKAKREAEAKAKAQAEEEKRQREQFSLAKLCAAYVAHLEASDKGRSGKAAASAFKCHITDVPELATLAATPAKDIQPADIALIVRRVMEQGKERTAGILRSYLLAAFNAARKAPFDASLPADLIPFAIVSNPAEPIATIPVVRGERTLTADELTAYLKMLGDDLPDLALKLALYAGGQRIAQLLRARLRDWDPEARTLLLYDGKGRRQQPRPHLLPLGDTGASIVEALAARAIERTAKAAKRAHKEPDQNPSLFVSRGRIMNLEAPGRRVAAIVAEMKCPPFDVADLRRTAETMLAGLGVNRDHRAVLLSHGLSGVQQAHYDRHDYLAEKRTALVLWEDHLTRLVSGKPGKVIPFAKREAA